MAISVFSPPEASQPGAEPQKRAVLVADDDPMSQIVLADLLQSWGHPCEVVGDGEEALRVLQKDDAPTIAFLDWQMPGLEGPEICRHVRAGNNKRYTYIFLVTARDSKEDLLTGLRAGADGYLTKPIDAHEFKARLDIASRFLFVEESLRKLHATTELYFNAVPSILIGADKEGKISLWNRSADATFGLSQQDVRGHTLEECGIPWITTGLGAEITRRLATGSASRMDDVLFRKNGKNRCLGLSLQPVTSNGGALEGFVITGADITERKDLEDQLRQAQKLEAIGQLAAGIAHEINTPTQFVGDNVRFLKDSWAPIAGLLYLCQSAKQASEAGSQSAEFLSTLSKQCEQADLEYLLKEIPNAMDQSLEGLQRVAKIVRAMKEFSHPGSEEKRAVDINRAIETTITVARNEWKYVADVAVHLDADLPLVPCLIGEFNQVILNLIINAAHAVAGVVGDGSKGKGNITITTSRNGEWAEIAIADSGAGIPEEIRPRIFEPFFTTKPVGKGTGQGLTLAHTVIVNRHQGQIWFESKMGQGTTFFIRLPLGAGTAVS